MRNVTDWSDHRVIPAIYVTSINNDKLFISVMQEMKHLLSSVIMHYIQTHTSYDWSIGVDIMFIHIPCMEIYSALLKFLYNL